MSNLQANVKIAVSGTAVKIYSSAAPCVFIAHGGTILANGNNVAPLTIGNSAVMPAATTPSAFMWVLNPGDSVPLPGDCATDLSALYINGSANDGISVGWFN